MNLDSNIILVLVLLAFVVLRKLHCAPCAKSGGHHGVGRDHPADLVSLPDSVIETSRPVKLKDFAEHYRIMSADSDFRFSEEYEEFKHVGRDQLCAAADLPVNRPKNRFSFKVVSTSIFDIIFLYLLTCESSVSQFVKVGGQTEKLT